MRTSKQIAEFCENLLKKRNEMVSTMCSKLNINQATFSMWKKNDVNPSLNILADISKYLEISLDCLVGNESVPQNTIYSFPDDTLEIIKKLELLSREDVEILKEILDIYYKRQLKKS